MYRSGLYNRAVGLIIVDPGLLVEPFSDKPGFVSFNTAISFPLGSENPFAADEVLRGVRWNKLPCLILEKSIKF